MFSQDRRAGWAATGLVFVVLDLAALFLPGAPPKASDSAAHIAGVLAAHRSQLLIGTYLAGCAVIALAFFLGSIRNWLAGLDSDPGLAVTATGSALLAMAVQLVGLLLFYGATFKVAAHHDVALVRALTDGGNAAIELSKFGFVGFIVAVCLGARRALSPRFAALGWASAGLLLLSAVSLVSEASLLQFGGGLDIVGSAPGVLWIGALAIRVSRANPALIARGVLGVKSGAPT